VLAELQISKAGEGYLIDLLSFNFAKLCSNTDLHYQRQYVVNEQYCTVRHLIANTKQKAAKQ